MVNDQAKAHRPPKRPGEGRQQKQKHIPDAGDSLDGRPADMSDDRKHFG
jgi:hypothetical protein